MILSRDSQRSSLPIFPDPFKIPKDIYNDLADDPADDLADDPSSDYAPSTIRRHEQRQREERLVQERGLYRRYTATRHRRSLGRKYKIAR